MIQEDNPRVPAQGQPTTPFSKESTKVGPKDGARGGDNVCADGEPNTPAETGESSVGVVFDLAEPDQARSFDGFRRAFGDDHAEVESLGHGKKVVLKLYPGGARRLL